MSDSKRNKEEETLVKRPSEKDEDSTKVLKRRMTNARENQMK